MAADLDIPNRCPTCAGYFWHGVHVCPEFCLVWCEERGETEADAVRIYEPVPDRAAELWAAKDDARGDYGIVGGVDTEVFVRTPGGTVTRWMLSGESVPTYSSMPWSEARNGR